jgi:MFS family permease
VVYGKIGDKAGRIVSMKLSTIIAAISTGIIALIPSFASWGMFSVVLLTLCRMMFLMSLAGEIDAIKIFVAEKIGKKRRNFAIGIVAFSSQLGVILASFMYHISISVEGMESLWRLNFVLGALLGCIVIMFRGYLKESQAFLDSKSRISPEVSSSVVDLIIENRLKFFLSMIANGMLGGGYHFLIIFLGTFAGNVADVITKSQAASSNVILIALYAIGCFISGYLADKTTAAKQILFALSLTIACTIIMEFLITQGGCSFSLHRILVFLVPFYSVPCTVKLQSLFPMAIRMRMYSLSHSIGSMVFSSTAPFVCMLIWRQTGMFSMVLGYFLLQLGILFFALVYIGRKEYSNFFEI